VGQADFRAIEVLESAPNDLGKHRTVLTRSTQNKTSANDISLVDHAPQFSEEPALICG
jgi:hypothetical protein